MYTEKLKRTYKILFIYLAFVIMTLLSLGYMDYILIAELILLSAYYEHIKNQNYPYLKLD